MEVQRFLADWDHPFDNPKEFASNIRFIHAYLSDKSYQYLGYAGSGGIFLGALAAHDNGPEHDYVHLRKSNDNSSSLRYSVVGISSKPIVIIDDHIHTTRTMSEIAEQLKNRNKLDQVIGVIARCFDMDLPENNKKLFNEMPNKLQVIFPNIKFWMCQKVDQYYN